MPSTLSIYKSHNERILNAEEGSFYALCRPRYEKKPTTCIKCRETFLSYGAHNRRCSQCDPEGKRRSA